MLGKTHRPFGVAMTAGVLIGLRNVIPIYQDAPNLAVTGIQMAETLGAAYLAGSIPDIDKLLPVHRGITHAIWIPLILAYLTFFQFSSEPYIAPVLFGLFLGYFFHLFGDAFSKAGIAWFYPLQQYERFENGAFYVKGFRGPFLPIYYSGDKSFSFMPMVWKIIAIGLIGVLAWQIIGG